MSEHPESGIGDGSAPYQGWPADARGPSVRVGKRKPRRKRREESAAAPLNLNSFMDIITIILVYLLKSISSSALEVTDPAMELPVSSSSEQVEEATVVMITGPEAKQFVDNQAVMVPNTPTIVVDQQPVVSLDPATYRVPEAQRDAATGGYVITPLRTALQNARQAQEMMAQATGKSFEGKVVIVADRRTPYRVLTEVLITCGESGFGQFKFAIIKEKG